MEFGPLISMGPILFPFQGNVWGTYLDIKYPLEETDSVYTTVKYNDDFCSGRNFWEFSKVVFGIQSMNAFAFLPVCFAQSSLLKYFYNVLFK